MIMRRMRRVAVGLVSGRRVRADIVGSESQRRASVVQGDFQDRNLFYFLLDCDEFLKVFSIEFLIELFG